MAPKNPRGTRAYRLAVANLKAQGATYCWRGCGTWISPEYSWPHPNCITLGHLMALEDGGHPTDPENHRAECMKCNSGDGAKRTHAKARGITYGSESYSNPNY